MKDRVLVLIDLQEDYMESVDRNLLNYVKDLIEWYDSRGRYIICVTFRDIIGESIINEIKHTIDKVSKVIHIDKLHEDGSKEIKYILNSKSFNLDKIVIDVVGISTDICVKRTVKGMSKNGIGKKIRVHKEGCRSVNKMSNHNDALNEMRKYQNVKVI